MPNCASAGATATLPPSTPIGADDAGGLGDDARRGTRHVVPAARRHVSHRHHERLLLLQLDELVPDQVAGQRGAAGRVDAQHHDLDRVVFSQTPQRLGDRARADASLRQHPARLHRDTALGRQHGNVWAAARPLIGSGKDADQVRQVESLAVHFGTEHRRELVGLAALLGVLDGVGRVADVVDQAVGLGFAGAPGAVLHRFAHALRLARRRHAVEPGLAYGRQRFGQRDARGLARPLAGDGLRRALVLAHVDEVGLHLELVERALEVDHLRGNADGVHLGSRAQPDAIAAGGQEPGRRVGERIGVADNRLALLAKLAEQVTHFFAAGPAEVGGAQAHERSRYVVVGLGSLERAHQADIGARRRQLEQPAGTERLGRARSEIDLDDLALSPGYRSGPRAEAAGTRARSATHDEAQHREQQPAERGREPSSLDVSHSLNPGRSVVSMCGCSSFGFALGAVGASGAGAGGAVALGGDDGGGSAGAP